MAPESKGWGRANQRYSRKAMRLGVVVAVATLLASCATEVTHDPRLTDVLGTTVFTKRPLRLYKIDPRLTGDDDHHLITAGYYPSSAIDSGEIGVLPTGHPVKFDKLRRTRMSGGIGERLLGTTLFRDARFPVSYSLGFAADESNAGWRMIYRSFTIPGDRGKKE